MGKLASKLAGLDLKGLPVMTAEITPPKGAGIKKLIQHAQLLAPHIDAVNITDCQRALVKMSSLAACRVLLDQGVEPVLQLTCRDRNSIALQSDLMGASALQIPNLLCLTGDPVKVGDNPTAKSVFEIESVELLKLVGKLQTGRDGTGQKMNAPTKFFIGSVVNPTLRNGEGQLQRFDKKIEAGARFFQTQANYDLEDARSFLQTARSRSAKILMGILILHTREHAEFIAQNIPGIRMPEKCVQAFQQTTDPEKLGIEMATQMMLELSDLVDGFHLMTIREEHLIPKVLEHYYANRKTVANPTL